MRKYLIVFALIMTFILPTQKVNAASMPESTGDNVADMVNSLDTYFKEYLPGIDETSRGAIKEYARQGLTDEQDKYFMPMMSTFVNMRKAGQAGEKDKVTDVINDFNKLSKEARDNVILYLKGAFEGIFLSVNYTDSIMTISDKDKKITQITFPKEVAESVKEDPKVKENTPVKENTTTKEDTKVKEESTNKNTTKDDNKANTTVEASKESVKTSNASSEDSADNESSKEAGENADSSQTTEASSDVKAPSQAMAEAAQSGVTPDVTTTYFTAYIPGVPKEYIENTKALIKEYSENGGGPAGSGALWRCIREIGTLMGREVDMAADYSTFTILTEGETEFMNLSPEIQEQVVDKVKEGMTGIAVTASFEKGIFTFTQKGETKFTYTVANAQPSITEEVSDSVAENETKEITKENEGTDQVNDEQEAGNSFIWYIVILSIVVAVAVGAFIYYKKRKR